MLKQLKSKSKSCGREDIEEKIKEILESKSLRPPTPHPGEEKKEDKVPKGNKLYPSDSGSDSSEGTSSDESTPKAIKRIKGSPKEGSPTPMKDKKKVSSEGTPFRDLGGSERTKLSKLTDDEKVERHKDQMKKWREAHPDYNRTYRQKYYQEHREEILEKRRQKRLEEKKKIEEYDKLKSK